MEDANIRTNWRVRDAWDFPSLPLCLKLFQSKMEKLKIRGLTFPKHQFEQLHYHYVKTDPGEVGAWVNADTPEWNHRQGGYTNEGRPQSPRPPIPQAHPC